jgi:hypothetical protein
MPAVDDLDPETFISQLCGSLLPADRGAFREAARMAIEQLPCAGPGIIHRVVSGVWRGYFRPPDGPRVGWDIAHELDTYRLRKDVNAPPIAFDGRADRRRGRA